MAVAPKPRLIIAIFVFFCVFSSIAPLPGKGISFRCLGQRKAIKVLVVGDSISQGFEADYTWRYRLWQWFDSNKIAIDFVGPYAGTRNLLSGHEASDTPLRIHGAYAADVDPRFLTNSFHSCLWGHPVAHDKDKVQDLVAIYSPDYILVEFGFNDILWLGSGSNDVLNNMRMLVNNARAAKPDLKFAIANIPHSSAQEEIKTRLFNETSQYNIKVADAINTWSSTLSPIALVDFQENYDCGVNGCNAGHDGIHPNLLGDFQIAQAFSKTLHSSYGLGSSILDIPYDIPARPCETPADLKVESEPAGIVATWAHSPGAYGYYAKRRLIGSSTWLGATTMVETNQSSIANTTTGDQWEFQIQANCGYDPSGNKLLSGHTLLLSVTAN